jgi:hypothetical protein
MRTHFVATGKRLAVGALLASLAAAMFAVPALAGPPERFEERPWITTVDFDNGLILFVNTTRADFCTDEMVQWENDVLDWIDGGEVGPFPEFPETAGLDPLAAAANVVAGDAVVFSLAGRDLAIELWSFDAGVFPDAIGVGPCTDSDEGGELIASGTTSWRYHDNDLQAPTGFRTNAFHDSGQGALTSPDGARWTYTFSFRRTVRADGTEVVWDESYRLVPRGR